MLFRSANIERNDKYCWSTNCAFQLPTFVPLPQDIIQQKTCFHVVIQNLYCKPRCCSFFSIGIPMHRHLRRNQCRYSIKCNSAIASEQLQYTMRTVSHLDQNSSRYTNNRIWTDSVNIALEMQPIRKSKGYS